MIFCLLSFYSGPRRNKEMHIARTSGNELETRKEREGELLIIRSVKY